jgi:SOS response regulatory protein OraA/RecX
LPFERAHSVHEVSAKLNTLTSGASWAKAVESPVQQIIDSPMQARFISRSPYAAVWTARKSVAEYGPAGKGRR